MAEEKHIFVSVGSTATEQQEAFVCAVEARLRVEGLIPHTVGRDTFSSDAPIKTVTELMRRCSGAVIIALERSYFPFGSDKRGGSRETALAEIRLATPWNQIEAAMAYAFGLPLLVIVELGIKNEGLLEPGYDWYVQRVAPTVESLSSLEFNGVLANWKKKIDLDKVSSSPQLAPPESLDPSQMSINQLLRSLKPGQLWSALTALAALLTGAVALGVHIARLR